VVESRYFHLIESAVLDALPGRLSEPFSLMLSWAALEDLGALLLHTREGVGSWESRGYETSDDLRAAMVETLVTLEGGRSVLAPAVVGRRSGVGRPSGRVGPTRP
jgi:hypothetical protein